MVYLIINLNAIKNQCFKHNDVKTVFRSWVYVIMNSKFRLLRYFNALIFMEFYEFFSG